MSKKLWIDGVAASEIRDSQGELLLLEGADISELQRFNDDHMKGAFNSLGIVTESKKIYKAEDCDDDRKKYFWDKVKAPYLYVKGYLHNNEDHPNARAAAAILRNIHNEDCPLKIKASVEGGIVERGISDPRTLKRTKIHSVALTFTPANHATLIEPTNLEKHESSADDIALIKSVISLARTDVPQFIPSFRYMYRDMVANKLMGKLDSISILAKNLNVNIEVPSIDDLMKFAVENKIKTNIYKIREIVQELKKERFGLGVSVPSSFHGWISPKGEYHKMDDKEVHDYWIHNKMSPDKIPTTDDAMHTTENKMSNDKFKDVLSNGNKAMEQGWISVGHGGEPNFRIHKDILSNKSHPAHKALSDLIGKHGFNKVGIDVTDTEGNIIGSHNDVDADHFIKYGKIKESLDKALTAGYSSGVPTSSVGGQVLQSESLNNKINNKIKNITCHKCGKEQSYLKYQVKCVKCNNSFDFDQLVKFMILNKSNAEPINLYHIHADGQRITDNPLHIKEIEAMGGVKHLESNGFRLIPHKEETSKQ